MKITENNNWEHRTYWVGDRQLTPETDTTIEVKLPGRATPQTHPIAWQRETHTYYDWGHQGSTTSDVPYIQLLAEGLPVFVKLDRFETP